MCEDISQVAVKEENNEGNEMKDVIVSGIMHVGSKYACINYKIIEK